MKFAKYFVFLLIVSAISSLAHAKGNVYIIEGLRFGSGDAWLTEEKNPGLIGKFLNNAASQDPQPTKRLWQILGDPQPGSWKTLQVKFRMVPKDKYDQMHLWTDYQKALVVSTDEGGSLDFSRGEPASEEW